jgi:hypothetical protein
MKFMQIVDSERVRSTTAVPASRTSHRRGSAGPQLVTVDSVPGSVTGEEDA